MNQQTFEKFFQKPEGFIWSEDLQCYYEHQDFRFKYPLESIGEFNLKWQGWLAAQQVMDFFNQWVEGIPGSVDIVAEIRLLK